MTRGERPRALGPGDMREVRRMTEDGLSAARIASELGCSASTVSRCRSQLGIGPARRQSGWTRWTDQMVAQLRECAAVSRRWADVAHDLDVPTECVRRKANSLHITLGGRGEAPEPGNLATTMAPDALDRWQRRRLVEAAFRCWRDGVTDMASVARAGSALARCSVACARAALPSALRAWRAGELGRRAA